MHHESDIQEPQNCLLWKLLVWTFCPGRWLSFWHQNPRFEQCQTCVDPRQMMCERFTANNAINESYWGKRQFKESGTVYPMDWQYFRQYAPTPSPPPGELSCYLGYWMNVNGSFQEISLLAKNHIFFRSKRLDGLCEMKVTLRWTCHVIEIDKHKKNEKVARTASENHGITWKTHIAFTLNIERH